jgi:hypothetical protein
MQPARNSGADKTNKRRESWGMETQVLELAEVGEANNRRLSSRIPVKNVPLLKQIVR